MNTIISAAVGSDLNIIFHLFEEAIQFQKKNKYVGWQTFDKDFIRDEVARGQLFKVSTATDIIAVFSICYSDPLIWRDRENGHALYIHRVVINQHHKGHRIFQTILDWASELALSKKLQHIRIDTWADNNKIIDYYKTFGFRFVEEYTTANSSDLPEQHRNLRVALLEYTLSSAHKFHRLAKVNLIDALSSIDKYWSQKIIGEANGQLIKLAKGTGEINWHKHDDQDELFIILKGHLTMQLRNQVIELYPNDLFIVPVSTEHCPKANGEVEFLIMGINITSNASGGRPEQFN